MLAAEAAGCSEQRTGERFSVLTWEQVQRLDQILGETVPIHGRGNFPTLSVRPRTIVQVRTGGAPGGTRGSAAVPGGGRWGGGWEEPRTALPEVSPPPRVCVPRTWLCPGSARGSGSDSRVLLV